MYRASSAGRPACFRLTSRSKFAPLSRSLTLSTTMRNSRNPACRTRRLTRVTSRCVARAIRTRSLHSATTPPSAGGTATRISICSHCPAARTRPTTATAARFSAGRPRTAWAMRFRMSSRYSGGLIRTTSRVPASSASRPAAMRSATIVLLRFLARPSAAARLSSVTASALMLTRVCRPGRTISSRCLPTARTVYPRVPSGLIRPSMTRLADWASGGLPTSSGERIS